MITVQKSPATRTRPRRLAGPTPSTRWPPRSGPPTPAPPPGCQRGWTSAASGSTATSPCRRRCPTAATSTRLRQGSVAVRDGGLHPDQATSRQSALPRFRGLNAPTHRHPSSNAHGDRESRNGRQGARRATELEYDARTSPVAPAYVLTATLGILALSVGERDPGGDHRRVPADVPRRLRYREFFILMPHSGTSFTWTSKASAPYVGGSAGWTAVIATMIVLSQPRRRRRSIPLSVHRQRRRLGHGQWSVGEQTDEFLSPVWCSSRSRTYAPLSAACRHHRAGSDRPGLVPDDHAVDLSPS